MGDDDLNREELLQIVAEVQKSRSELETVEVKSAHEGTPKRLFEPLSAFANSPRGGVIVFGLDEGKNFDIVGVENAAKLQADIASLCSSDMEPSLHPEFTVETFEGKTVVAIELDGVPAVKKPCYHKPTGMYGGSYIRVGSTNRRMSEYEVFGFFSNRLQPTFDQDPIPDATIDDLDAEMLHNYLARLRRARPQAKYLNQPLAEILLQLKVVTEVDGALRPTLAGLLVFGKYPQSSQPQLVITFLQFYGTTETEMTNSDYKRLNHIDAMEATKQLRSLVQTGLVKQHGTKRGAYYTLNLPEVRPQITIPFTDEEKVIDYVRRHGRIANRECRELLDLKNRDVSGQLLAGMCGKRLLERKGERKGAYYIISEGTHG